MEKVKRAMLTMQRAAWEQGAASTALVEMEEKELALLFAKEALVRQKEDGRLAMLYTENAATDPASNGEGVLYAGKVLGDPAYKAAADKMLNYFLHMANKNKDGILYHVNDAPEVWSDSGFMAPPFLAIAGRPEEAIKQMEGFRRILWDPQKRLYSHIWSDASHSFKRKAFWGVGNGWTMAGMAKVIRVLPAPMSSDKKRLAGYIKDLVDTALKYQRSDSLYHDVIDDPKTFVETNFAQMLSYTIYRGTHEGWLDPQYRAAADKMRKAVHSKVDAYGFVRGVCGSPAFESSGTATEGQAFFLLMEAAYAYKKGLS